MRNTGAEDSLRSMSRRWFNHGMAVTGASALTGCALRVPFVKKPPRVMSLVRWLRFRQMPFITVTAADQIHVWDGGN